MSKSNLYANTGGGAASACPNKKATCIGPYKGSMIMKSVSIFLASGRRVSHAAARSDKSTAGRDSAAKDAKTMSKRQIKHSKLEEASGKLQPQLLDAMKKKTHFSKPELEALCRIYRRLVANCQIVAKVLINNSSTVISKPHALIEGLDRIVFRELLHTTFNILTEDMLMERIYCAWEKGYEGLPIRLEGWFVGLSVILRGTHFEKITFCFRVYDLNGDGFITRDEMLTLLKGCLIKQPQDEDPEEGVKEFVEILLKKFDCDKDGKISFNDYLNVVTKEPLLLEAFGHCLPSENAASSFLLTLRA